MALLWLWCRLAAVAPILPLAWELQYATGAALKKEKKKKKKERKKINYPRKRERRKEIIPEKEKERNSH